MIEKITEQIPFNPGKQLEDIFAWKKQEQGGNFDIDSDDPLFVDTLNDLITTLSTIFNVYEDLVKEVVECEKGQYNLEKMQELLIKFNEDLVELTNSLVTICGLCNIDSNDIFRFYERLLTEANLHEAYLFKGNTLKTVMCFARHYNIQDDNVGFMRSSYVIKPIAEYDKPFSSAGRCISPEIYVIIKGQLWDLVNTSSILNQSLKYHNTKKIQETVMILWVNGFKFMDLVGCTEDSIYETFFLKKQCK